MTNDTNELDEMRRQIALLNRKIERESLVNDQLIRRAMRSGVSTINSIYARLITLGLVCAPLCYFSLGQMGLPLWFRLLTMAFLLLAVGYTRFIGRELRDPLLMTSDLLEARRRVAKARKAERDWLKLGLPFLAFWLPYLLWFLFRSDDDYGFLYGVVCGVLVGGAIGLAMRRKTMGAYREIIEQIDELTTDNR